MKFSILTSVHLAPDPNDRNDRLEKFEECIKSVEEQNFKDFEWIVINDGSTLSYDWDRILLSKKIPQINLITREHGERVVSLNAGLAASRGDWIEFLDSDDELKPNSLERMNYFVNQYPKSLMFNFGAVYAHSDGNFTFRDPFMPKSKTHGHEVFGGGNIVNGTFIFSRKIYEDLGGFPGDEKGIIHNIDCTKINYGGIRDLYMGTPYDFSAAAQLELPELRKFFMVDHEAEPKKIIKELGNPWGQDMYLFFKYTRKYHSRAIKEYLYIVNPK